MTKFQCKVYGKGMIFLQKEVRDSLGKELLLFHSGKAAVIVPADAKLDDVLKSIQVCIEEIKLTLGGDENE